MPKSGRMSAILALAAQFVLVPAFAQERPDAEGKDFVQARQDWFYKQRAFPHDRIPAGARLNAINQLDKMLSIELPLAGTTPQWHLIGPQPTNTPYTTPLVSGRVTAIAIHPRNPSLIYLGTAAGGLWKSSDGGGTWVPLTDQQPSLAVGSVAIDPANPSTIYIGTGEENFSGDTYYGAGILKSTDGGATWTQYPGPFVGPITASSFFGGGARIGGLAINPANSQILLAAVAFYTKDGVYRSTDGGQTWTQVLSGNPGTAVLYDPTNGNRAYAALEDENGGTTYGMYVSNDGGSTWSPDSGTGANLFPSSNVGRISLAMVPSSPMTLYAGVANSSTSNLLGIYKTTDGGTNWQKLSAALDYCASQCWYDNALGVSPTNPNLIYAGGAYNNTLTRSTDGGATWKAVSQAGNFGTVHADIHALTFSADGKNLFIGSDGGPYLTSNPGAATPTFTPLNSTLAITQFYPGISIHPTTPTLGLAGTQDNGTQIYSGSLAWTDTACGDGGWTAIDPNSPSTYYTTCAGPSIQKSTSSGAFGTWVTSQSGINTSDRITFIPPLAIDPTQPQILYVPTYRVYQTQNGAASWTPISPDLTTPGQTFGAITAIAVAPSSSDTVYAGTYDSQFWISQNATAGSGATWTNHSAGLPPRTITELAVDYVNKLTAYVVFSGFTGFGDSLGHVFKTVNGGASWADISGNLPNTPINDIAIHPSQPNTLFVATDTGVYTTSNGGITWSTFVNGLPRLPVLAVKIHAPEMTLRAATHGRGVWDVALGATALTYSPGTINFGSHTLNIASTASKVTLTNSGTQAIAIGGISVTGVDSSEFTETNTCGTSLAAAARCTISVLFKPVTSGPRTANLVIADSGLNGQQYVFLAGDGSAIGLSPAAINFGAQTVGGPPVAKSVKLTNHGAAAVSIGAIVTTGANPGDFAPSNACGSSVPARASCTITVTFTAGAKGARSATLSVNDSGGGNAQTVALSGTGK